MNEQSLNLNNALNSLENEYISEKSWSALVLLDNLKSEFELVSDDQLLELNTQSEYELKQTLDSMISQSTDDSELIDDILRLTNEMFEELDIDLE